jgi:uncharacterized protein with PQ loop repeat
MLSLLGILGGILFLIAPLPAAIRAIKAKKTDMPVDVSLVVCLGTVTQYVYLLLSYGFSTVLFANYLVGFVCWAILLFFGVFKKHVAN